MDLFASLVELVVELVITVISGLFQLIVYLILVLVGVLRGRSFERKPGSLGAAPLRNWNDLSPTQRVWELLKIAIGTALLGILIALFVLILSLFLR